MTEMSSMSTVSVSQAPEQAPQGGEDTKFVKIGLATICLLLLCIGVAYFHRGRSDPVASGESGGGAGDDDSNVDSKPPGFFVDPPSTTPSTRFTRRKTTTEQTTSPTPDRFPEPPRTPPPIPKKLQAQNDTILCSVTYRAVSEKVMVPDGLCDFVVYTEIRFYGGAIHGEYDDHGFRSFFAHAKKGTKSRYGASFGIVNAETSLSEMKKVKATAALQEPWNSNVKDFGMLHVYDDVDTLRDSANRKLALLKQLKRDQEALAGSSPKPHLFLGVMNRYFNSKYGSETATMFAELTKRYAVTILVAITHFFLADGSHAVQPPSVLKETRYKPASLDLLGRKLASSGLEKNIIFMTSFTMAVSHFRMDGSYQGGLQGYVESYAPIFFNEVCYLNSSLRIEGNEFAFVGVRDRRSLLTFETAQLLIYKVATFYQQYAHPRHGVALYDIDYDSTTAGSCVVQPYSRVHQLRRYLQL